MNRVVGIILHILLLMSPSYNLFNEQGELMPTSSTFGKTINAADTDWTKDDVSLKLSTIDHTYRNGVARGTERLNNPAGNKSQDVNDTTSIVNKSPVKSVAPRCNEGLNTITSVSGENNSRSTRHKRTRFDAKVYSVKNIVSPVLMIGAMYFLYLSTRTNKDGTVGIGIVNAQGKTVYFSLLQWVPIMLGAFVTLYIINSLLG